jgi:hypothetical protein
MQHIQNIDIDFIVTTLKIVPNKYSTPAIKVAKGKNKLPTTLKQVFKKLRNG